MYGEGISKIAEILDMAIKMNIVEKAGSFYSYDSERMGQGEANARDWLKNNPEKSNEILQKIMAKQDAVAEEMTTGPSPEDEAE